jgi:hypothetical protein
MGNVQKALLEGKDGNEVKGNFLIRKSFFAKNKKSSTEQHVRPYKN